MAARRLVVANWKMSLDARRRPPRSPARIAASGVPAGVDAALAPSFAALDARRAARSRAPASRSPPRTSHPRRQGAFTGEVSAAS